MHVFSFDKTSSLVHNIHISLRIPAIFSRSVPFTVIRVCVPRCVQHHCISYIAKYSDFSHFELNYYIFSNDFCISRPPNSRFNSTRINQRILLKKNIFRHNRHRVHAHICLGWVTLSNRGEGSFCDKLCLLLVSIIVVIY